MTNPPLITPPLECIPVERSEGPKASPVAARPVNGAVDSPQDPSGARGHPLLAIDPHADPYRVRVPGICMGVGVAYVATVQLCVSPQGTVDSVQILEPSIPLIDEQLPVVLGRWLFHPYLVDGKPTSFCYHLRYRVM